MFAGYYVDEKGRTEMSPALGLEQENPSLAQTARENWGTRELENELRPQLNRARSTRTHGRIGCRNVRSSATATEAGC